jgi:hypothetical protein
MLINMRKDPGEMKNIASDAASAPVLAEYRALLRRRVEELGDEYGRSLIATTASQENKP